MDSTNSGALVWLLLIIPFKYPCPSTLPYIGLRGILRLVVFSISFCPYTLDYLWSHRASPNISTLSLLLRAGLNALFVTAAISEAYQTPELSSFKEYHDRLAQNFLMLCTFLLLAREILEIVIQVPGPLIAKFTFFWRIWHLARGTSDRAIFDLHQTYGTVVRISPYEYSVAQDRFTANLYTQLQTIADSNYILDAIDSITNALQTGTMPEQLLAQASTHEPTIDVCITSLIDKLAGSLDTEDGIKISKLLTCFCWEVMAATTIGDHFEFLESTDAASVYDKIANYKKKSVANGSLCRFFPRIAKLVEMFISQDDLVDDYSLVKETLMRCHVPERPDESGLGDVEEAIRDLILEKFEILSSCLRADTAPSACLCICMCFLIAAADPIAIHLQTTLAYLSCYPDAQSRIKEEAQSYLKGNPLTMSKLLELDSQLPYLDSVLRESDRLGSADALACNFSSEQPVVIDRYRIPQGATIRLSRLAAGRDKSVFGDDADEWNPMRWLDKEMIPAGIAFGSTTLPYGNAISKAVVANIVLRLVGSFQFTANMRFTDSKVVYLSAQDLEQLRVCVKNPPSLSTKLSALTNPSGVTILTGTSDPFKRLLALFEGAAQQQLQGFLNEPDKLTSFATIQSSPVERKERKEIHHLIRELSKGKLDSATTHSSARISVFLKGSASIRYHNTQTRPFQTRQSRNTQPQQRPQPRGRFMTPSSVRKPVATRVALSPAVPTPERQAGPPSTAVPTTDSQAIGPSTAPVKDEREKKLAAWGDWTVKENDRREAIRSAAAAPPTETKPARWAIDEDFKLTKKYEGVQESTKSIREVGAVVSAEEKFKKNAVAPHRRAAAPHLKLKREE